MTDARSGEARAFRPSGEARLCGGAKAGSPDGSELTVLVPTKDRPSALAVTLSGLLGQRTLPARIIVSDQSERSTAKSQAEVATAIRALRLHGVEVECHTHLPRRGMAEQRSFLLEQAATRFALFLDDDLLLGPAVVRRLLTAIIGEGCGFVGCAPLGLSYSDDVRAHEQHLETWDGPVLPEKVRPNSREWRRHTLHNAANLLHVQRAFGDFGEDEYVAYKVAWVGGCVLFDTEALRAVGGFDFWRELPAEHAGEDVVAQLRVMGRFGGCGVLPSEVYHLEVPTTITARETDAPHHLRDFLNV